MARDYYAVLGVEPDASNDGIKEAYFSRMRVVHPDKHNHRNDAKVSSTANELAAELNEAYNTLRDPGRRAAYDADIKRTAKATTTATPQQSQHARQTPQNSDGGVRFSQGELTSGKATWRDLPTMALASLLKRQEDKLQDQVRVPMGGVGGNYFWIVVLLCWFAYLIFATGQPTWTEELYYGYAFGSALAAMLIGVNISSIRRYSISPIKNNLYLTPIYLIETTVEKIAFWPIWSIKKLAVTHHHENGSYKCSALDVVFESEAKQWAFKSKKSFEHFYKKLAEFDATARENLLARNGSYFETHDDFRGLKRSGVLPNTARPKRIMLPGATTLAGILLFLYSDSLNKSRAAERWFYHKSGQERSLAEIWASFTDSELILPSLHDSEETETPLSVWEQAQSQGEKRLPIDWSAPTQSVPLGGAKRDQSSNLSSIQNEEEARLLREHGLEKIGTIPAERVPPPIPPQPMPPNGKVKRYHQMKAIAPLQIITSGKEGYFVKMMYPGTNNVAATVFIQPGMKVQFDMPLGSYEMRYAAGKTWYGENFLFGEKTSYSRAGTIFDFAANGNQVEGYTVELFLQENGNLETESIRAEDF